MRRRGQHNTSPDWQRGFSGSHFETGFPSFHSTCPCHEILSLYISGWSQCLSTHCCCCQGASRVQPRKYPSSEALQKVNSYQSRHEAPVQVQESPRKFVTLVAPLISKCPQKYDLQYTKCPCPWLPTDHRLYQMNLLSRQYHAVRALCRYQFLACQFWYPPDKVLCLLQKRVVSMHPPRLGQMGAMVDGSSQAWGHVGNQTGKS
uniref:Uncharacterized protein n=1 Tax=Pipistrellus kuhlii TaxID=59472 RepID=A0A7J7ZKM5_PIPKU|nr:hypothetical protein mPipKuh1_009493 [Pipistrellus kuhlii]